MFENYVNGWKGFSGVTFTVFFKNSLFYAGLGTVLQVCSSAVVAYAFARISFPGRKLWFTLMLLTIMLPQQILLIPQYFVFSRLGRINSFKPLLIPRFLGGPFFIFLMVQFMRGIPKELDAAGRGIFFRILLPLIQPALITAGIFSFYWT